MEKDFGEYLQRLRGKLSLREAAEKSNISHTYIRDLELGKKTDPSKETLYKIAKAYDVRLDDLLYRIYNTKLSSLETVNSEAREHFLNEMEIILNELTTNNEFFDFIKDDILKLEKKYDDILNVDENITPSWLKDIAMNARYDSEWIYDIIKDLKLIARKYNLHLDLRAFLLKDDVTYKGILIKDKEKQLIKSYLDALFPIQDDK